MKQPAEPTHTPQASQTVSLPLSHLPLPPLFILLRAHCPGRAFPASRLPCASCVITCNSYFCFSSAAFCSDSGSSSARATAHPISLLYSQRTSLGVHSWLLDNVLSKTGRRQTVVFYEYLDLFFFLSFLITLWGTPFLMCSHSLASLAALSCIVKLQLILCSQGLLQEFSKVGPEPEYFFCCFPKLSAGRLFPQSLGPSLPIMIPRVSAWVSFFTSPNQTLPSQDSVVNLLQFFILFLIDGSLV